MQYILDEPEYERLTCARNAAINLVRLEYSNKFAQAERAFRDAICKAGDEATQKVCDVSRTMRIIDASNFLRDIQNAAKKFRDDVCATVSQ